MSFFHIHRRLFLINILSILIFLFFAISIDNGGHPFFDIWANTIRGNIQTPALTSFMTAVTTVFEPTVLLVASILLFIILFVFHKRSTAFLFLGSLVAGLLSVVILKSFFDITRPVGEIAVSGTSFPSAHATAAAIFFLTILFSLEKKIKDQTVNFLLDVVAFGLVFLTGVSRIYLGVHWVSDVLAGFALGMFWVSLSFLLFYRSQFHMDGKA